MTTYRTVAGMITVSGYYELEKVLRKQAGGDPIRGAFKEALVDMLRQLRDYAAAITHSRTGHLAGAHTYEYDSHRMVGRLFLNPRVAYATGSRVRWPFIYGVYEHRRGGPHAFYERTMAERGNQIGLNGVRRFVREYDLTWK